MSHYVFLLGDFSPQMGRKEREKTFGLRFGAREVERVRGCVSLEEYSWLGGSL